MKRILPQTTTRNEKKDQKKLFYMNENFSELKLR